MQFCVNTTSGVHEGEVTEFSETNPNGAKNAHFS